MGFALRCVAGDLAGQSFPVAEAPRSIGRSHRADIRSALPDVSSIHALISVHGGELRVEVVSVRVTTLNGRPLRQGDILPLSGGDLLRMGGALTFEAVLPPASPAEAVTLCPEAMAHLGGGGHAPFGGAAASATQTLHTQR